MYRWVEHTAEVEVEIRSATEAEVFADALAALAELLGVEGEETERRLVTASAPDRPALLAAWLEELVFLAESEGFEPLRLEALNVGATELEATVRGRLGAPPPLVKGVTYHRLAFESSDAGYCARVVLDV